jgi:hypothetical protein
MERMELLGTNRQGLRIRHPRLWALNGLTGSSLRRGIPKDTVSPVRENPRRPQVSGPEVPSGRSRSRNAVWPAIGLRSPLANLCPRRYTPQRPHHEVHLEPIRESYRPIVEGGMPAQPVTQIVPQPGVAPQVGVISLGSLP